MKTGSGGGLLNGAEEGQFARVASRGSSFTKEKKEAK